MEKIIILLGIAYIVNTGILMYKFTNIMFLTKFGRSRDIIKIGYKKSINNILFPIAINSVLTTSMYYLFKTINIDESFGIYINAALTALVLGMTLLISSNTGIFSHSGDTEKHSDKLYVTSIVLLLITALAMIIAV